MPSFETTAASPYLAGETPLPTVHNILANPEDIRARDTVHFVFQTSYEDGELRGPLCAFTEAELLHNLDAELASVARHLPSDSPSTGIVNDLRQNLGNMGPKERAIAANEIAKDWLQRLDQSKGQSRVVVWIEKDESSLLVYADVLAALKELEPGAVSRIRPILGFTMLYGAALTAANESGAVMPDDWAQSGEQLQRIIRALMDQGVDKKALTVQLLASPPQLLENGIDNVPCQSHYTFPYAHQPSMSDISPGASLVGMHSRPEFGFRKPVEDVYRDAWRNARQHSDEPQPLSMPLLYHPARVYDPSEWETAPKNRLSPEHRRALQAERARLEAIAETAMRTWHD